MGEIAVGDHVGGGPERYRPQDGVAGNAGDAWPGGVEGRAVAPGDRKGVWRRKAEGDEQAGEGHDDIRNPELPRLEAPQRYPGRVLRRRDEPDEYRQRYDGI